MDLEVNFIVAFLYYRMTLLNSERFNLAYLLKKGVWWKNATFWFGKRLWPGFVSVWRVRFETCFDVFGRNASLNDDQPARSSGSCFGSCYGIDGSDTTCLVHTRNRWCPCIDQCFSALRYAVSASSPNWLPQDRNGQAQSVGSTGISVIAFRAQRINDMPTLAPHAV